MELSSNSLTKMWSLMIVLVIGLQASPIYMIKIGISHNYNTTISTTTPSPNAVSSVTTEGYGNTMDLSSPSPQTEMASTPSQTFPPRRHQQTTSTTTTTTTPAPLPTAETQTSGNATESSSARFGTPSFLYYCSCDLREGICDLNCCCDRDCPSEILIVFNCLGLQAPAELQTRLEDFQYTHGLPTCQLHDGWLCVFRSNTKPIKMQPIFRDFDSSKYRKWPDLLEAYETDNALSSQSYYKFGQALQLWLPESKESSVFNLPTSYETSHCYLRQAIRHLQPTENNCLMTDISQLQENLALILNITSNYQLLGKPRDIEETEVEGLNIQICQQSVNLTRKLSCLDQANDTQIDLLVDTIELEFLHNYTNILGAKLFLREAPPRQTESEEIWLHYKVSFKSVNETASKPISGPLGYLTGSPVIASQLLPKNESSDVPQILSYFDLNDIKQGYHWLPLFHRQVGTRNCQRKLDETQALRFGINLAQQCQLTQLDAPQLQENANHTQYCENLQAEIWHKLLPHNCTSLDKVQHIFISQLGRPQVDKWLPLQLNYGKDLHNLPPVQGYFDEIQQSLSCRNIFLSVRYEFHVEKLSFLEGMAPHQQVLQHARIVLGQRHDLEFDGSEQQIELPLAVSVMFYKVRDRTVNSGQRSVHYQYYLFTVIICLLILK
ncbi:tectonic [Drosophila tropicalis]|uniref:tectonic n=1 Tax=Drosophila tropicalis TaxID=46794 RepID=UPI0035AB8C19